MDAGFTPQPAHIAQAFRQVRSTAELARLLQVAPSLLESFIKHSKPREYVQLRIPKRQPGKFRELSVPNKHLKDLQRRLCVVLNAVYRPTPAAFGFVPRRNCLDNAIAHRNEADRRGSRLRFVFNIDLKDFFDSIRYDHVVEMFMRDYKLPKPVAQGIATLCCHNGHLPQGAPTSPVVSNMVCAPMDRQLAALAKRYNCFYTRYADDITFSTIRRQFPARLAYCSPAKVVVGPAITTVLDAFGFTINPAKVQLRDLIERQEITGVVVNEFPNVRRSYVRQIRAMLHDWEKKGYQAAAHRHQVLLRKGRTQPQPWVSFRNVVRGKIAYVGLIRGKDDPVYTRLLRQYRRLDANAPAERSPDAPRIYISYAHKDRAVAVGLYARLQAAGFNPWIDVLDGRSTLDRATAMPSSTALVVLLSANSVDRRTRVHREVQAFRTASKRPILVLNMDQQPMIWSLDNLHAIDNHAANAWNLLTQQLTMAYQRHRASIARSV